MSCTTWLLFCVQGFCDGKDCQKFMIVPGEFGSKMDDKRDVTVRDTVADA